jgi:hypothetical protein
MKWIIWSCVGVFVAACAAESPSEESDSNAEESKRNSSSYDESALTTDSYPTILIQAKATDSLDHIQREAIAVSAAACHGTTTCPGGLPISGFFTLHCGSPMCSTTGCGKPDVGPPRVFKVQPRERYQAFSMPDGAVCLAFQPTQNLQLNTCCILPPL